MFSELEKEALVVLPERVETSYFSATVSQGNLGIQLTTDGGQMMAQGNFAAIFAFQH